MMRKRTGLLFAGLCLLLTSCSPFAGPDSGKTAENTREAEAAVEEGVTLQGKDGSAESAGEEARRKEASSRAFEIASSEFESASLEAVQASKEIDRAAGEIDLASNEIGSEFTGGDIPEQGGRSSSGQNRTEEKSRLGSNAGSRASLSGQDSQTAADREADAPADASLTNPIRGVDSPKEFHKLGLSLRLPENEQLYQDVSCSVIGEQIAQIEFYDKFARSDAIARAGKKENGDPSGVYYIFDDSKRENWAAVAADGSRVYLTMQVTTKNSDVPGVLVSWEHDGMLYSLWEDNARKDPQSAAKMGMEIARESSRADDLQAENRQ